jgi:PAS domain S-box-containing protein
MAARATKEVKTRSAIRRLFRLSDPNIRTRLIACFVLIVLLMIAADAIAVWQFRQVVAPAQRLNKADQMSHAVVRVHLDVDTFRDRMAALASGHDTGNFENETAAIRQRFLQHVDHAEQMLRETPEIAHDASISSALQSLRVTLPSQLDSAVQLAAAGDWNAIQLRLANQIPAIIDFSSSLVESVDQQLQQQLTKATEETEQARQRLFIIVPIAALLTLLSAAALGWYVTRTITAPLSELTSGAQELALGNFQHKVEVEGDDELAVLGNAFNYAARQLQELYQSLRDSEEQWRAAFESNPTMYFMLDTTGTILSVNAFGAEQLGYGPSELVGQSVMNVLYEPDRNAAQQHAKDCFDFPGRTIRWEARKIRKDGTMLWARETANAAFLKDHLVLLVVCEDITEQKRAEDAARRSQQELRDVIDTVPAHVWSTLPDGSVDLVNQRWEELTGLPHDNALGWKWEAVIHPDDRAGYVARWRSALENGRPMETEVRLRRVDGEYRWFLIRNVPLRDQTGSIVKWYGSGIDIEDRKRAEGERERLRQLEAELAHINRVSMMGELAASLGHEIKQPITAAITNARTCLRWLQRGQPDLEEARDAALRTVEDAMRSIEIVNRTRSLYKKEVQQRKPVNVNEIIQDIIALFRNEAAHYGVSIRCQLATDIPKVMADRVQLQQVLMNLTINAIDAMKPVDGDRELTVRSMRDDNDELVVSVSDTGVGLPPKMDQVFNPFYTTKPHGTGMGLAISRTIIESHGGGLSAKPNTGRGATFYFTLPLDAGAHA